MYSVVQTSKTIAMHIYFFHRFSASSYVAASHPLYQIVELWVTLVGVENTDDFRFIINSIITGSGNPATGLVSYYIHTLVQSLHLSNNPTPNRFMGQTRVCSYRNVQFATMGYRRLLPGSGLVFEVFHLWSHSNIILGMRKYSLSMSLSCWDAFATLIVKIKRDTISAPSIKWALMEHQPFLVLSLRWFAYHLVADSHNWDSGHHYPFAGNRVWAHRCTSFWNIHHKMTIQPNAPRIYRNTLHMLKFMKSILFGCET